MPATVEAMLHELFQRFASHYQIDDFETLGLRGFIQKYSPPEANFDPATTDSDDDIYRKFVDSVLREVGKDFMAKFGDLPHDELAKIPTALVYTTGNYEDDIFMDIEHITLYIRGLAEYITTLPKLKEAILQTNSLPHNIDVNEVWHLLIDGNRQLPTTKFYEFDLHEPGYIQGTISALTTAFFQIGTIVTAESIGAIQAAATHNVYTRGGSQLYGGYRFNYEVSFVITVGKNASETGLRELRTRLGSDGDILYQWCSFEDLSEGKLRIVFPAVPRETVRERVSRAANEFNGAIGSAANNDERMAVIAALSRNVDQLHAFGDGNVRTAYVLANRLLVEYGMLPMILENPNIFDAYTIPELVEEFKKGQETFKHLCLPPQLDQEPSLEDYIADLPPMRSRLGAMRLPPPRRARSGAFIGEDQFHQHRRGSR